MPGLFSIAVSTSGIKVKCKTKTQIPEDSGLMPWHQLDAPLLLSHHSYKFIFEETRGRGKALWFLAFCGQNFPAVEAIGKSSLSILSWGFPTCVEGNSIKSKSDYALADVFL